MRFEVNRGQADRSVRYLSRGIGYGLYLTGCEAVLTLRGPAADARSRVLRMQLEGANGHTEPMGIGLLRGRSNYLVGNDPSKWRIDVPAYGKVRYKGVYPGVDLIYYGNQQQLEYDFVVAPQADPAAIRLHFAGASAMELDHTGDLIIEAGDRQVAFRKPVVYQMVDGRRRPVAGRYTLMADNSAGFSLGSYDRSISLVIDPTLVYSTFLGGSNLDSIVAIALDSSGAAYLTGSTSSTDYPVTHGVIQATDNDPHATAFVTKLNSSGTALIYSTFLGGSGSASGGDNGEAIAVDATGNAFVTGYTYSSDFPTTKGAYQVTNKAAAASAATGFVTKLNPSGTGLVYSTFLGGTGQDEPMSLALDSTGDVFLAGAAFSANFPTTTGVIQTTNKSAGVDGWNEFVTKLNPAGGSLAYSTYLGGSNEYSSPANIRVAVDKTGDAYVAGVAISTDFPVTGGVYQPKNDADSGHSDMTLSELNPTATRLIYSTYLGGSGSSYGDDVANGLAVDAAGSAYLAGSTHEANFPVTPGAFQSTSKAVSNGLSSGFVTKMNPGGTGLVYSTYLGGSGGVVGDSANALAVDSSGDVYITGSASSTDFPVTGNAYQTTNPAAFYNGAVVFLTELNPAATILLYSTYFGGTKSFDDAGNGVTLGSNGTVYLAGITGASDFPITTGAFESNFNSQQDSTGFVAEFTLSTAPSTIATTANLTASENPAVTGQKVSFTVAVVPNTGTGIPAGNVIVSIDEAKVATIALNSKGWATYVTPTPLALGQHAVLASYVGNATYSASGGGLTESVTPAEPVISPPGGNYVSAQLVSIADATKGADLYYTTDGSTPTSASTRYSGPILVSASQTIRAIAMVSGAPASLVGFASYSLVSAPSALAAAATAASTSTVTLNGLVNTNGMAGSYYFQYGTNSTGLTSSTPKNTLPASVIGSRLSFIPVPVSALLTGLKANTKYYYQVVVTTAAGISSGAVLSFTTH
jgi:hypothetical protein